VDPATGTPGPGESVHIGQCQLRYMGTVYLITPLVPTPQCRTIPFVSSQDTIGGSRHAVWPSTAGLYLVANGLQNKPETEPLRNLILNHMMGMRFRGSP
jgi:hypothetical protein